MYTLKDLLHPATVKTKIPPSERAQQLIVIRLCHLMLILSVRRVNITTVEKKNRNLVCLFIACFNCYSASFRLPQALPWSQKFVHTVDKPVSVLKCTKKKKQKRTY